MNTKDKKFWLEIWNEREHISEVSGHALDYDFGINMFFVFSHVLTKAAYPEYRYLKENIMLMTLGEHQLWDFKPKSELYPEFNKVKKRAKNIKYGKYKN